jgi:hypothetical protein
MDATIVLAAILRDARKSAHLRARESLDSGCTGRMSVIRL